VGACEWKLFMAELRTVPMERLMAAVAVVSPALKTVIGVGGTGQVCLMAGLALHWSAQEVAHLSSRMAAEAGDGGVRPHEWEPSAIVESDLPLGDPIMLVVALRALGT